MSPARQVVPTASVTVVRLPVKNLVKNESVVAAAPFLVVHVSRPAKTTVLISV
jgi:hypothetical protein